MRLSEEELLDALRMGETPDWEFKSGKGGVPKSLWESYSAMANTDGGTIVLGVEEVNGVFTPNGLPDPAKAQKVFWDNVNNRGKVSANLLTNQDVVVERLRMLADQSGESADRHIVPHFDRLELSNPGSLLLSVEQMFQGGVSECRNKALQVMFQQMGRGEKAGSGMNKINTSWASQKWRAPIIRETTKPARVRLALPMTSLLPDEAVNRLQNILGPGMGDLQADEVQFLVTALLEGFVSNQRLQQLSESHPTELTKLLQNLCANDYLEKQGYGRWANYRLSPIRFPRLANDASSGANDASSGANDASLGTNDASSGGANDASSGANDASSGANDASSGGNGARPTQADVQKLRDEYDYITHTERVEAHFMDIMILEICGEFALSRSEIAEILHRKESTVRNSYLPRLLKEGRPLPLHPNPTHPDQRYRTNPDRT